jgi:hypothetical protein
MGSTYASEIHAYFWKCPVLVSFLSPENWQNISSVYPPFHILQWKTKDRNDYLTNNVPGLPSKPHNYLAGTGRFITVLTKVRRWTPAYAS